MLVTCALLCDAATVREGLLHILGGGVTRLHRSAFPAPMNVALGLQLLVHPTEADRPRDVKVVLQAEDGAQVATLDVQFEVSDGDLQPGEQHSVPIALPLHAVALPRAGGYSVEVLIDGSHHASLPFLATPLPKA